MQNILVVEDDRELNEALCYALDMPNKNRIVAEKEQCYNTKNNDRRLLDTSVVGGVKESHAEHTCSRG